MKLSPEFGFGRRLDAAEARAALLQGVTSVLDLTAEFSESAPFRAQSYRNIQILDLTAPSAAQLQEAGEFIAERATHGPVYVHCKVGYSRSAAIVGAYLLASGRAQDVAQAVSILRQARPGIVIRPEALEAVRQVQENLLERTS